MTSNPDYDSAPPAREVVFSFSIPSIEELPAELAAPFTRCLAEAQMLEHSLKKAIANDIAAFAPIDEQSTFLDFLKSRVTLGQAHHISTGASTQKSHVKISAHVGFFDVVKMQWAANGRSENELENLLKSAVGQRNRIAHTLLSELLSKKCTVADAILFLASAQETFLELRILIAGADFLSGKIGGIASDGSTLPRVKVTNPPPEIL